MLFTRKKNNGNEVYSPKLEKSTLVKPTLQKYRDLQKGVRDAKEKVLTLESDLRTYENELVKTFTISRQDVFEPFTIVELSFEGLTAVGQSRRSESDNKNPNLGFQIALGRAQRKLIDKINKENTQREVLAG